MGNLNVLQWGKPTNGDKFGNKGRMFYLAKTIAKHYTRYKSHNGMGNQPFRFYLDSRFSSIKLMQYINQQNFEFVMSCSSNMKPKAMMTFLKVDTPLRHWRIVDNTKHKFRLMGHQVKRNKFLFLASHFSNFKHHLVQHRRYKFPRKRYWTVEPVVINDYNMHMGNVDLFDKMVQKYWRRTNYVNHGHALTSFFIQACIRQAFIASNHHFGLEFKRRNELQFRVKLLDRILETYSKKKRCEKKVHIRVKQKLAPKDRKTCTFRGCRNKTSYFCKGCNNNYYCLGCMSSVHL